MRFFSFASGASVTAAAASVRSPAVSVHGSLPPEPCPSASVQLTRKHPDLAHLGLATGKEKLVHPLPEAGQIRRYCARRMAFWDFPGGSVGRESSCNAGNCLPCRTPGFALWVRKTPGGGNGNPLQYSSLETPMDRGAWRATVSPW